MPAENLLTRTLAHARRVWPLVLVPLVATLLDVGRLRRLVRTADPAPATGDGVRVVVSETDRLYSVTFGVPRPVTTLWSFVNATGEGVSTGVSGFDSVPLFLVVYLTSAVLTGLLAAAYLGTMNDALEGRVDVLTAVRSYGLPLVGFSLLGSGVGLLLIAAGFLAFPFVVVTVVGLFVFAYLFFAAPYLVVVEDRGLAAALRRAFDLATTDRRVAAFFVGYIVVSALLSVPVSAIALAEPPIGVALAVVVAAPLALLLNVATLLFVRDLVAAPQSSNIPVDM